LFLGALLAFRLWQRHESALNWPNRPKADVGELLSWAETLPGYVVRARPRKPTNSRMRFQEIPATSRLEPRMPLELNMAAAEDLRSLPGVGPVLSQRIVRFRDVLGGFHDIDDLYEVYGLDSSVVDGAKAYVTVDATLVRPVCLDTVSFRSMLKHPRFDVETTKKLMRARGRGVHTLDVILGRSRLDSAMLRKVQPYLTMCSEP
jgi:predicted DNA-binding helix-hairpin-helix protein